MAGEITLGQYQAMATEEGFQEAVLELAGLCGWECFHVRDSRRFWPGWPDWICFRPGRHLWFELKRTGGVTTKVQEQWLARIRQSGGEAYVWRPQDWEQVEMVLAGNHGPSLAVDAWGLPLLPDDCSASQLATAQQQAHTWFQEHYISYRHWLREDNADLRLAHKQFRLRAEQAARRIASRQFPGLMISLAQSLVQAGYPTPEAVRRASDDELLKVHAVGPVRLRLLRDYVGEGEHHG